MKKFFRDVEFDEATHSYTAKGKKAGISTTGLIELYGEPFNAELIAPLSAKKQGKEVEEILAEWDYTRDYSCERGNQVHLYAQSLWSGSHYELDYNKIDSKFVEDLKKELPTLFKQCESFYNEYKDLYDFIEEEQYLYNEDYDVAGSIDLLLRNKLTGEYVIVDFKTYGELHKKVYNKMKIPLQKFDDENITHISFQTEVYKQIFEIETGLKVGEVFGVYFSVKNKDYEIIDVKDMQKEVKKILEMRRVKNMQSMAVLILGQSGAGKSALLRNVEDKRLSLINVLGKQLPFKNNFKNVVTTDNYEVVKANIKKTSRNLVVVDDAGYLITNEFMRNHSKGGGGNAIFGVYNSLADNYWNLISEVKNIDGGKIIYFIMHEETDEFGKTKPKTIGKMLDEKVCVEGMFTVVLRCECKDGKYIVRTKTDGNDVVKTPIGMFEQDEIDNDLNEIDKVIREYYELDKVEEKEIKKDEENK